MNGNGHRHLRHRVRRIAAILLAAGLVASAGSTALVSAAPRNSFVGDFDLVDGSGVVVGHIKASLFEPTDQRLVPGSYDFRGVPGNVIRESHAQVGNSGWWYDPNHPTPGSGGSNVGLGEGVECLYFGPNDTVCHTWAVMYIDVLDPAERDQVAFANNRDPDTGEWLFEWWFWVGKGEFNLRVAGDRP